MIIVRLRGGLGNQMFQYALGRSLSFRWHTDLYLDLTLLAKTPQNTTPRNYDLNKFNIKAVIASTDLLKQLPTSRKDMLRIGFQRIFNRRIVFQYVKEQTIDFDERILGLPDNIYIDGYWQSEKYFSRISNVIREDFSFLYNPSENNQRILDEIQGCNSVSIHIRRGDYVNNAKIKNLFFVCDDGYYRKAIEIIMKQIQKPHFFIFSDDPDWARNHIVPDAPVTYISHNMDNQSYEDLRLMIHCKHHIIANSSFSWWGAWLGKHEAQIVVAPGKWFNTKRYNDNDRLPPKWLVVN
jgi:hypothetical protein